MGDAAGDVVCEADAPAVAGALDPRLCVDAATAIAELRLASGGGATPPRAKIVLTRAAADVLPLLERAAAARVPVELWCWRARLGRAVAEHARRHPALVAVRLLDAHRARFAHQARRYFAQPVPTTAASSSSFGGGGTSMLSPGSHASGGSFASHHSRFSTGGFSTGSVASASPTRPPQQQ